MGFNERLRLEAQAHLQLAKGDAEASLNPRQQDRAWDEVLLTTPLFTPATSERLAANKDSDENDKESSVQYGLLGFSLQRPEGIPEAQRLVYANVSAPWSAFICGSQGSGKSYSLSCLLENALLPSSPAGRLTSPLAGLAIHYDKFTAFSSTQLCEAAYLYSSGIPVRVLVSPTNFVAMKTAYGKLAGGSEMLTVEPLYLPQKDLNISMMKTLMGINGKAGQPLYVEVVMKILRDMAIANQGRAGFNYAEFKNKLAKENFIKGQLGPLNMRLNVLESFFEPGSVPSAAAHANPPKKGSRNIWKFPPKSLTIIDLSCPFVDPEDAFALFNIAASLFLKDRHQTGRVLAMDEAHKFLNDNSPEAVELNETLLSMIRQQRHIATRVLIATQEPTLAPALLELCNTTIIHRFSSPAWYKSIQSHIAGANDHHTGLKNGLDGDIFSKIVQLATGEALVFCPTALLDYERPASRTPYDPGNSTGSDDTEVFQDAESDTDSRGPPLPLGPRCVHIRVRQRITMDGGRSLLEL
ncbi:unnamed protein product [Penicillium salamii]|uniref:AAA+ ATPase domain-containing protein n=1 Tax=Penicillium salamii TaxID=1612424 RepID=A0A9W4K1S1_9EURO|nr:unnamed protein product [Penicillium salamii]CAG8035916.1 unnamed protein product [Penicillium salamii]CAG8055940.1 unnamed protein product [Penicillium salamii]CAG8202041.1 unnamed protein product [Penicillium salamii]CAG8222261.1 unnamed protein product [Penicillium salamii]